MSMDVGTIGSAACEVSLNEILMRLDDRKLNRLVLKRYNDLRETLEKLKPLNKTAGNAFFKRMVNTIWNVHKTEFEKHKNQMPEVAYTHALCCYKAVYRRALKDELGTT